MYNEQKKDIERQLIDFIINNYAVSEHEIDKDSSLVDQGIIDSIGLIEISSFLEKTYSITITEEEMTRENFGSVNLMVDFASNKI